MNGYSQNRLWANALGARAEAEGIAEKRQAIVSAYLAFRENAALLAGEIAADFPWFTQHDVSHLDALWDLAPDLAGEAVSFTPTEAFVFGGAVLVHDLGLAAAAYPGGRDGLKAAEGWRDAVAVVLLERLNRFPYQCEIEEASETVQREAIELVLRKRHAIQAERLGLASWGAGADAHFLIESRALRSAYGALIGRIAASHWWELDRVRSDLGEVVNPPAGYPGEWTVDALKLAALLRAVDAAHIDARRAPSFLQAIRNPRGISRDHWTFQSRLHRPTVQDQRLSYTAGEAFTREEAGAWWQGYDLLRLVDRELRGIDDMQAAMRRPAFAARGVVAADSPEDLSEVIRTDGWTPVDAAVRVSDVAGLVERMGGARLYGRDATVPLRELIQNGIDAVKARRHLENRTADWGSVRVALKKIDGRLVLQVTDTGVGMSERVLSGQLIDFGASLWRSADLIDLLPGLAGAGFQSTGQFGIGFFSVLMLGGEVRVVTRRAADRVDETRVLELANGVKQRPLIRPAQEGERLVDPGTSVAVWLDCDSGQLTASELEVLTSIDSVTELARLCQRLAPSVDVSIDVEMQGDVASAVVGNDWMTSPGTVLDARARPARRGRSSDLDLARLRVVEDVNGQAVARIALSIGDEGVMTIGGLVARSIPHVLGVARGVSPNLARTSGIALVAPERFRTWLEEQGALLAESGAATTMVTATLVVYGCAIDGLPICEDQDGRSLSADEVGKMARELDKILVVDESEFPMWLEGNGYSENRHDEIEITSDYLTIDSTAVTFEDIGLPPNRQSPGFRELLRRVIAEAWEVDPDSLSFARAEVDIGEFEGEDVAIDALVIQRP